MRYDHFTMLPERAFQPRNGRHGMTLEGGGGGGPTQSTVTQTNIPEWLRPQTEALLGAATQEYFQTKPVTTTDPETGQTKTTYEITGVKPYTPYSTRPQDYVAGFSPLQEQVMREAAGMQRPEGFERGSEMAGMAGRGGLESAGKAYGYGQEGFRSGQLGQQLGVGRGAMFGELGAGYGAQAAGMSPMAQFYGAQAAGLAPQAQRFGTRAADIGEMALRAEMLGRDVGEEARQYARQAAGMGGMYERMATSPYTVQQYMSPYQQAVTDMQLESARRQADISRTQRRSAAARAGAFGGSRQAIEEAEANRALQTQLQNIQAQGLQSAYDKAIQAMQYGVGTGLQGLQGAQAGLGTALSGGQLGLSGIGQAMAGQQAGLAGLGQAGQLYGQGLAGLGQAGQLYGLGMQGAGMGLQGLQQQLAGTAQGMQGAGVGLQGVSGAQAGYGLANTAAANLANIANQQQAADIARMQFQAQQGALQQAQEQAITNQAIQNYGMAQQHAQQQLSGYSGLLRGYYTPTRTETTNLPGYNPMAQLLGTGMQAYGFGKMAGAFKEGGSVKEKKYDEGGIASISQKVMNDPKSYSREMINKGINSGSISKMAGAIGLSELENAEQQAQQQKNLATPAPQGTILGDLQQRASAGIDQLPSNLPVQRAASGGIIAFEDGGDVNEPIRFQNEGLVDMVRQQQMEDPNYRDPQDIEELIAAARRRRESLGKDKNIEAYEKYMEGLPAELSKSRDMSRAMAIASMGSKMAQTRGRAIPAISAGLEAGLPQLAAGEKEYRAGMGELMRGRAQLGQAARAEAIRGIEAGEAEARSLRDLASRKEIANLDRDARKYATDNPSILVTARSIMKPGESLSDAVKRVYGMQQTPEKTTNAMLNISRSIVEGATEAYNNAIKAGGPLAQLNMAAQGNKEALSNLGITKEEAQRQLNEAKQNFIQYQKDQYKGMGVDIDTEINRAFGKKPSDTANALPLPAKQSELEKGKVYNTARGPATWDGTQFIPVR